MTDGKPVITEQPTLIEMSVREKNIEIVRLREEIAASIALKEAVDAKLKDANDFIEEGVKSKLITELTKTTTYDVYALMAMDTARLQQLRDDQTMYSDRKLVAGIDMSIPEGDVYEPLRATYGKYHYTREGRQ